MDKKEPFQEASFARLEDLTELKARYQIYSDEVLSHWINVVTGPHREAMIAILQERGLSSPKE